MNECFPGLIVIDSLQGLSVPYLILPRTFRSINLMKSKALLSGLTKVPHLGERLELQFSYTNSTFLFVTSWLYNNLKF